MTNKISLEEVKQKMLDERRTYLEIVEREYPRIYSMIMNGWGTRELHEAFVRMLVTDTEGRKGFPGKVGEALVKIHMIHQFMFDFEEFKLIDEKAFDHKPDRW